MLGIRGVFTAVAAAGLMPSAEAEARAGRIVLWQDVAAGMSADEVRALYPEAVYLPVKANNARIEIARFEPIADCPAKVRISLIAGAVDSVELRGAGAIMGKCSTVIQNLLIAKYGLPDSDDLDKSFCGLLSCEGRKWTAQWTREGVTMDYSKRDGGGLISASWVMRYALADPRRQPKPRMASVKL